jgi:hypothetical protein
MQLTLSWQTHCRPRITVLYFAPRTVLTGRKLTNGWHAVINVIANIFGALGAIVFVGYFAYKVAQPPLIIIVVFCLCLMVYSFYDDMRNDRTIAQFHKDNAPPQ